MVKQEKPSVLSYVPRPGAAEQIRGAKWWILTVVGWFLTLAGGSMTLIVTFDVVYFAVLMKHARAIGRTATFDPVLYGMLARSATIGVAMLLAGLWMLRRRRKRPLTNEQIAK